MADYVVCASNTVPVSDNSTFHANQESHRILSFINSRKFCHSRQHAKVTGETNHLDADVSTVLSVECQDGDRELLTNAQVPWLRAGENTLTDIENDLDVTISFGNTCVMNVNDVDAANQVNFMGNFLSVIKAAERFRDIQPFNLCFPILGHRHGTDLDHLLRIAEDWITSVGKKQFPDVYFDSLSPNHPYDFLPEYVEGQIAPWSQDFYPISHNTLSNFALCKVMGGLSHVGQICDAATAFFVAVNGDSKVEVASYVQVTSEVSTWLRGFPFNFYPSAIATKTGCRILSAAPNAVNSLAPLIFLGRPNVVINGVRLFRDILPSKMTMLLPSEVVVSSLRQSKETAEGAFTEYMSNYSLEYLAESAAYRLEIASPIGNVDGMLRSVVELVNEPICWDDVSCSSLNNPFVQNFLGQFATTVAVTSSFGMLMNRPRPDEDSWQPLNNSVVATPFYCTGYSREAGVMYNNIFFGLVPETKASGLGKQYCKAHGLPLIEKLQDFKAHMEKEDIVSVENPDWPSFSMLLKAHSNTPGSSASLSLRRKSECKFNFLEADIQQQTTEISKRLSKKEKRKNKNRRKKRRAAEKAAELANSSDQTALIIPIDPEEDSTELRNSESLGSGRDTVFSTSSFHITPIDQREVPCSALIAKFILRHVPRCCMMYNFYNYMLQTLIQGDMALKGVIESYPFSNKSECHSVTADCSFDLTEAEVDRCIETHSHAMFPTSGYFNNPPLFPPQGQVCYR